MKKTIWGIRLLFLLLFVGLSSYIVFMETEKYESVSTVLLKDLSQNQEVSLGSLLTGQGSETAKDSKIMELFIGSYEMYDYLDAKYALSEYYVSTTLDDYQRLYKDAFLPAFRVNRENLLKAYNKDLLITFDTISQTLTVKFAYADANISQNILQDIIKFTDKTMNKFESKSAEISLAFINEMAKKNRALFIAEIKKLIVYQNKYHTIDPHLDVERKNTILAELEADLTKKEVEYSSKVKTKWNTNGYDMRTLKANIVDIKRKIKEMKDELSGNKKNDMELNVNVFDFEVLKNEMEFAKEVYRETLINQEKLKIEVKQNAKHLVVISKPTKPDSYTYPDKIWDLFTLFLTLFLLYSIVMTAMTILRDHRD